MDIKLDALKRLDKDESVNKIAIDKGVGRTTIGGWIKSRAEIESRVART
jgi:hypothetical protein